MCLRNVGKSPARLCGATSKNAASVVRYSGHKIQQNSTNPGAGYPDRLGPSSKFVENSIKLIFLEITGYPIKYSTVLWLPELQIRRGRKVQTQVKGKAVPLQAWSGPEGSRKLRFPDFMTTAQDGVKVVSLTHRPPLPQENTPGTHFCRRLSRPQGRSATGRMSLKNSNDTIGI